MPKEQNQEIIIKLTLVRTIDTIDTDSVPAIECFSCLCRTLLLDPPRVVGGLGVEVLRAWASCLHNPSLLLVLEECSELQRTWLSGLDLLASFSWCHTFEMGLSKIMR